MREKYTFMPAVTFEDNSLQRVSRTKQGYSGTGQPASFRIGILGYSDIAARKFIPALFQSNKADFAGVARRQSGKTVILPSGKPAAPCSYHNLVYDPTVDIMYVSLPNHLHETWSIRALEQGKHVLCEKPLGLSTASVRRMLDAAKANDRLLYENLMYLQHPQHRMVQELIVSGRIGRVTSFHAEFAFPGPAHGNFRLDPAMGGGAFHDMNRYPLSAALFFLKGTRHRFIRAHGEERNGLNRSFEGASLTEAGERFTFLIAFDLPYRSFYEITGELGSIRVERAFTTPPDLENRIAVKTANGANEIHLSPLCDHFLAMIDHACGLIRGGTWDAEHERSMQLATLADLMQENCTRKEV